MFPFQVPELLQEKKEEIAGVTLSAPGCLSQGAEAQDEPGRLEPHTGLASGGEPQGNASSLQAQINSLKQQLEVRG